MAVKKRNSKEPAPEVWKCRRCGEVKPFTRQFFKSDPHYRWGLVKGCKDCWNKRALEKRGGRKTKPPRPEHWACNKCGELKPFTHEFFRKGSGAWGLVKVCRTCALAREAEWRKKNPTAYSEYHAKNRERRLETIRAWHRENRDKVLEWEAKFKDQRRSNTRNYRAKKAAGGTHSGADIARIGREQKWLCIGCRQSIKNAFHVDHIVPVSKGGSNDPSNLQLLCQTCNLSKGRKDAEDFMRLRGYLL